MEIRAKVLKIHDQQNFGNNGKVTKVTIQEINDNVKWEHNPWDIEFINDKTDLLENIKVGEIYIFHFNIVGRDYKGRNFTNIRCWRITEDDSQQNNPIQKEQKTTYISTQTNTEQDDDLPF